MSIRVLIVDPDQAFAMLLKEGLEAHPEFRAVEATSSGQAIIALQSDTFDLAIIDLTIDDSRPWALLRTIRDLKPELPLMVIPLEGEVVPKELTPFDIGGVLTKPFFLPDLPARLAEALGRPLPDPAAAPASPPPASRKPVVPARALPRLTLPKDEPRVGDSLRALAVELSAEAVLLTNGSALAAYAGPLDRFNAETLAQRIEEARAATAQTAWTGGGGERIRFGQSISTTGEHLLYSLEFTQDYTLTVAVRPDSRLHVVRAATRQTADALLALGP